MDDVPVWKVGEKNPEEDVGQDVLELIMGEKIEVIVPLLYYCTILMASYGPNSQLFGGINITIWHWTSTINLDDATFYLAMLFAIDSCSLIINSIMLWIFCRINCFNYYLLLAKGYWIIMAIGFP